MKPNSMRPNSIRAHMTLGFALFTAMLMLLVCAAFYAYTRRAERHNVEALLFNAKQEIQQELAGGHPLSDATGLVREENAELRVPGLAMLVINARGRVETQSTGAVPAWPLHEDWRVTSFKSGAYKVVLALPWGKTELALREHALLLLALSTLVVVASAAGAWFLVGRTLAPIDHLASQAQTASTESLRVRLDAPSADTEITRLVTTMNGLLARLEQTAAVRGRFYAAASHELRTPLQALTGTLEVALSRKRAAPDYEIALREGHAQAERLTTLVQDLLLLNQLDADTSRPPAMLLDLVSVCETEFARLRPLADERGLTIEMSLPEKCEISAPWNHIEMLARNLLENAVKYATPHGTVSIQLSRFRLSVWNSCAPVQGWDADKYFEPFFRPDASRNSQTGGNGLGLAICKAICASNDWDISLCQEASGVCAAVEFKGI